MIKTQRVVVEFEGGVDDMLFVRLRRMLKYALRACELECRDIKLICAQCGQPIDAERLQCERCGVVPR